MQSTERIDPHRSGQLAQADIRWGVVLLHGFTAGPGSVRLWGQSLASAGATVFLPLLPGHGTSVRDLAQTKAGQWRHQVQQTVDHVLSQGFDRVAVGGLSLGGTLALDAAAHRPIDATLLVNPALTFKPLDTVGVAFSPLFERIIPTVGPLAGDIKKPGVIEEAYTRTPVPAVQELSKLFRTVRGTLSRIRSAITLYWSPQDHIIPASSAKILQRHIPPQHLRTVVLPNSYHVGTLDHDAPLIHQDSIETLHRISGGEC